MAEFQTVIKIECGAATCASEPGKFCRYFGTKSFGSKPVCMFFRDEDGNETRLFEAEGWTARCKKCLDAFRPASDFEDLP